MLHLSENRPRSLIPGRDEPTVPVPFPANAHEDVANQYTREQKQRMIAS